MKLFTFQEKLLEEAAELERKWEEIQSKQSETIKILAPVKLEFKRISIPLVRRIYSQLIIPQPRPDKKNRRFDD